MDVSVLGVSIHHALGGRPLWLAIVGAKNSTEAQAAATIAGHRLHRVLGGFTTVFPLENSTAAACVRLNEIAIVGTYIVTSSLDADGTGPQAVIANCRTAILELCGGHVSDVTLPNLNKLGAAVQLALRKAALGFGVIPTLGHAKFDFATAQVAPEPAADDSTITAVRVANDVTAASLQPAIDAYSLAFAKMDTLIDSVTALRYSQANVTPSVEKKAAKPVSYFMSPGGATGIRKMPPIPAEGLALHADTTIGIETKEDTNSPSTNHTRFARPAHELSRPWAPAEDEEESDDDIAVVLERQPSSDGEEEEEGETPPRGVPTVPGDALDNLFGSNTTKPAATVATTKDDTVAGAASDYFDIFSGASKKSEPSSTPVAAPPADLDIFNIGVTIPAASEGTVAPSSTASSSSNVVKVTTDTPPTAADVSVPNLLDIFSSPASNTKQENPTPTHKAEAEKDTTPHAVSVSSSTPTADSTVAKLPAVPVVSAPLTISVKLASVTSENITVTGVSGGAEKIVIEGSSAFKYMLATSQPDVERDGFPDTPFSLLLHTAAPLEELSFSAANGVKLVTECDATSKTTQARLLLPQRAKGVAANAALDVGVLHYKLSQSFTPHVIKFLASAKHTFDKVGDSTVENKHVATDVLVRSLLHPAVSQPLSNVQFLVQLPHVLGPKEGSLNADGPSAPAYASAAMCKPHGTFNPAKNQLLWSVLADDAPLPPSVTEDNTPRLSKVFAPGKAAEFKGRVPITHGVVSVGASAPTAVFSIPAQLRFSIPVGTLFAPRLEAVNIEPVLSATGLKAANTEPVVSVTGLKAVNTEPVVSVTAVLQKGSSNFKAMWKEQ